MTPCAGSGARRARRIHGAARRGLEAMSREGAQGALAADLPRAGALPPHPRSRRGAGLQGGEPLQPMPSVWRSCRVKGAARRLRRSAAPTLDPASTQKSNKIKTLLLLCAERAPAAAAAMQAERWAKCGRACGRAVGGRVSGRPRAVHWPSTRSAGPRRIVHGSALGRGPHARGFYRAESPPNPPPLRRVRRE